ncbi:hypothetical protein INT08_01125 [Prosthecochloris sp. N3]|uniref:YfhO family protein n=1 Tax=Prosthecochloris ethylica TaxID=2743976 RepID=A0ABR9XP86_9CHLB|nr:hypothetical protein [Prosthecochloris ethylica]MBF0585874.1 hypothetical protein [Prosthecochloris ethylica]MBF0635784.1 hypothetical protein [Prosthecochloris ethylica]NUK47082.1 hypothetical protein [Prosthecochloris ethylica]
MYTDSAGIAALCLALVSGLFFPVVFQGMVPASPDSVHPMALSMALDDVHESSGHYPLWQPWSFCGMPSVAAFSYLNGLYYPGVLLEWVQVRGLLLQLLHMVFAGAGGYVLLRSCRLRRTAAVLGGTAFMLNPYLVTMFVYGHGSQLMTSAYMPWVLWAALRVLRDRRVSDIGMLALLAGFQLQRAHVQIAYYSWIALAILAIVVLLGRRSSFRGSLPAMASLGLALGLGVVISLQVYLPALDYAPLSVRGGSGGGAGYEYATMWSQHPAELLTLLLPGAFGFGGVSYWGFMPFTDYPNYAGFVVLVLAAVGAWSWRGNLFVRFLLASSLFLLLVAFGTFWSPVYDLMYHYAPFFNRFRVPSMSLAAVMLHLCLLAGFGLHTLLERPGGQQGTRMLKTVSLLFAVVLIGVLLAEPWIESSLRSLFPPVRGVPAALARIVDDVRWEQFRGSVRGVVVMAALLIGLFWLRHRGAVQGRIVGFAVLLLALSDLLLVDTSIVYPARESLRRSQLVSRDKLERALGPDEVTRFLAGQPGIFRIYPAGSLFGENKFTALGIESAGGYHPAKPARYDALLQATGNLADTRVLRMLNVGYVLSAGGIDHPDLEPVLDAPLQLPGGEVDVTVYRLRDALERAWFTDAVTGVDTSASALDVMLSRGLDVRDKVFAERVPWEGTESFEHGEVVAIERTPERRMFRVRTDGRAFLVISEVYLPTCWKALVDGKQVEPYAVNGVLHGIVVPPGEHRIELVCDRSCFAAGRRWSAAGVILALLLVVSGGAAGFRKQRM